jgi:Lamin Tail Domain
MRKVTPVLLVMLATLAFAVPAWAQYTIGGHNETSENFGTGWTTAIPTPGTVPSGLTGAHVLITEIAARGVGAGSLSDSSEFVEIFNPSTLAVDLSNYYISDDSTYWKVVNGPYAIATTDFNSRFPGGTTLNPGQVCVICVTKSGFAASQGVVASGALFFELKDSNGSSADDMINVATGSTLGPTGGAFTNPSTSNGEEVMLYYWDQVSDLVCDVDYAAWGTASAANPRIVKTGVSIDGPDAGTATSTYNADTPSASQTSLGTVLNKPGSYQRTTGAAESGEVALGGNGCVPGGATPATHSTWGQLKSRYH